MIDAPANTIPREIAERADHWAGRFEACLDEWNSDTVSDLHEALDFLASEADAVGAADIAITAIELSVYLCSFIDEAHAPDANQQQYLRRLMRVLRGEREAVITVERETDQYAMPEPASVPETITPVERDEPHREVQMVRAGRAATAEAVSAESAAQPRVLCISDDANLVAELFIALAAHGVAVTARGSLEELLASLPEMAVQAVLVDAPAIGKLQELERHALKLAGGANQRPSFIALLRDDQIAERMRALRAGADQLVAYTGEIAPVVARIASLLVAGEQEPLRVLVIDDDRSQTLFCDSVLRHAGTETRLQSDPHAGLAEISDFKPDVVLLDLYMPEIDGLALAERIRAMPGSEFTSIIFLSGDQEADTRFHALAAGGDDYLTKPVLPRHLVAAVQSHGRRVRQLRRRIAKAS